MKNLTLILGNQLFPTKHYLDLPKDVFMCEDIELCTRFKYHKHKIMHFLSSMRSYREELKKKGKKLHYFELEKTPYIDKLKNFIKKNKVEKIFIYEIEDKFFESKLLDLFHNLRLDVKYLNNPNFLCSRERFRTFLSDRKSPLMNHFYIEERKKHEILLTKEGRPIGGKWNYDDKNRKKIPKNEDIALFIPPKEETRFTKEVSPLIDKHFSTHPGSTENFWIPTSRKKALHWYKKFLKHRFSKFGDYQDALDERSPFLYHSLISPLLNIGFLSPKEVVEMAEKEKTPHNINSVEGFIRQVMGWREFIRGIYQNYSEIEDTSNFFNHKKLLSDHWYNATSGIPPLDFSIQKAIKWGYCHHIERLMVIGNLMLLLEVKPTQVHRWFMEMFVDSSDWVMGPNVYGMSQFSDGGIFATKPYISGSNYLLKMGHYKKDSWCQEVDGLYWRFIDRKREFFEKNHRMNMMVKMLEKKSKEEKKRLFSKAQSAEERLTKT